MGLGCCNIFKFNHIFFVGLNITDCKTLQTKTMSIATFSTLHVEELYLQGKPFTVDNFKGAPGDTPTINADGEKGDNGSNWTPIWDDVIIGSPEINQTAVYTLPNPLAEDIRYPIAGTDPVKNEIYSKTMFLLASEEAWKTGATVSIMDHNNNFLGRFYQKRQKMRLILADNVWKIN
jgi:hypothetical protein